MDEVVKNRQVNYKKKITPELLESKESGLNSLREAIERAKVIVENLKGNLGWEALKKTYSEKVEHLDQELERAMKGDLPANKTFFASHPQRYIDYLLTERILSVGVRDTLERMESQIEFLEERFAEDKAKLDEHKSRARVTSPNGF